MPENTPQPNILLITTDEQRYDTYGAEHANWPQPSNLARLRREGTTLTNAYSNSPLCQPCRYGWLTGLYGCQTERGARNGYDWPDDQPTMPQALQRQGYHTGIIGKLHAYTGATLEKYHMAELEPHSQVWGFDTVYEGSGRGLWSFRCNQGRPGIKGSHYTEHLKEKGLYEKARQENMERGESRSENGGREPYRPGVLEVEDTLDGFMAQEMCEFVEGYDREEPFFLHASFFGPHYPLDVPEKYFQLYSPDDMPVPRGLEDSGEIRSWRENRAMYMGLMTLVDDQIGQLLESLEKAGHLDDTVVLFTTDHGDMLGDHGHARKICSYEGSCRTPILVRYPESVPADTMLSGLVESVDLTQTILEIAGLDEEQREEALPGSPGKSFWNYVREGGPDFRDSVYAETGTAATGYGMRMVRAGDWKYTRTAGGGDLLFNLAKDPHELSNLAENREESERLSQMQGRLIDRMANVPRLPRQGRWFQPSESSS
ncbi:MAG: sulfatase [Candidatus Brocadiia bacterium]